MFATNCVIGKFSENEIMDRGLDFGEDAQKMKKFRWKPQNAEECPWKVIHKNAGGKVRKKDLYTELSTLSTENRDYFRILSLKKRTLVLSSSDKKRRILILCWHLKSENMSKVVRKWQKTHKWNDKISDNSIGWSGEHT